MFLGVGWGNNVHVLAHSHDVTPRHVHLHVRTIAHIRHATLKMCHVTQGWGGVGWGIITFTYLRTPMMLRHGTFTCTCAQLRTYVMLRWRCVTSRRGGVGWGNNVHVLASVPDQLTSCPENEQKLNDLIWTYVRTWQWRWEANVVGKALLEKTGAYLAKM